MAVLSSERQEVSVLHREEQKGNCWTSAVKMSLYLWDVKDEVKNCIKSF